MLALVTATEGRIRRAWFAMLVHLREENSEADIAARLHHHEPVSGVLDAARLLAAGFLAAYTNAAQTTARWIDAEVRQVRKMLPVFDPSDPPAAQWASQNRLDLVREIDDETRAVIRDILTDGARSGANPLAMAKEIRESIGLTDYQRGIVENYRRELMNQDYVSALQRELSHGASDKTIAAALKANRAMTPEQIDKAVERYRQNWVDMRARSIARTEGLRVAHQGSEEMYRQAVERGDLDADRLSRTWVHGPPHSRGKGGKGKSKSGDRWFHVSMNGQTVGYGEKFVSGMGGELRYPCDPDASAEETVNCRCVVTTRILPGASGSASGRPSIQAQDEEATTAAEDTAAEDLAAEDEQAALEQEFADEEAPSGDTDAPDGFDAGDRPVFDGIPTSADLAADPDGINLYRIPISDLEPDLIALPGGGQDEVRVQSIRDAWSNGRELPPVKLSMTQDGKFSVTDGRHRLLVAAEQGRDILADIGPAAIGTEIGTVPLFPAQ